MEVKHTPGPWKCGQYLGQSAWVVHMDAGDRGRGMDIVNGVAGLTHEERLANARLIAAAPDLLAALEWMLYARNWSDTAVISDAVLAAKSAIARAKGNQ